jgi:hypothetical protein
MNIFDPQSFMKSLRQAWQNGIQSKDGANCPCCDRYGKVYKRNINKSIATTLKWFYIQSKVGDVNAWFDIRKDAPRESLESNEYAKLLYWQLIEKMPVDTSSKKKSSGTYRITRKGIDFVEGSITISKNVFIYNNEVLGVSEEMTDFVSCLEEYFDYQELMTS